MLAAALVTALASPATAKTVSAPRYAKSVCGTLDELLTTQDNLATAYNTETSDDPATFQGEAVALVNGFIADLEAAQKKLEKLRPDVSGGKRISRQFRAYLEEQVTALQDAVEVFAAADPNGIAFQAAVASFEIAFDLLSVTAGDPFSAVRNQDLLDAFDKEPRCADIVTVF